MDNKRDFLLEAVKIIENKSAMKPEKAHLKALYDAWMTQVILQHKVKTAITNLGRMSREGKKLPTKEEIPFMLESLMKEPTT